MYSYFIWRERLIINKQEKSSDVDFLKYFYQSSIDDLESGVKILAVRANLIFDAS